MKNNLIIFILLFTSFLVSSCEKENPSAGDYIGIFSYEIPQGLVKTAYIEISNPTQNSITINGSKVSKKNEKIEGHIDNVTFSQFSIDIIGEWSHKIFSKEYVISGTFTETYYQGGNQYQNSGTFEIKSN